MNKKNLRFVPLCPADEFQDTYFNADTEMTVRQLLERKPALSMDLLTEDVLDKPLSKFIISVMAASSNKPLYRPPGMIFRGNPLQSATPTKEPEPEKITVTKPSLSTAKPQPEKTPPRHPNEKLSEEDAVKIAYRREIEDIASFLRTDKKGLSVLVYCDKIIVAHLIEDIVRKARREKKILEIPEQDSEGDLMSRGTRQRQLSQLKLLYEELKTGQVLVIPHLDLLAGSGDNNLSNEARELTELVYKYTDRLILAFADRSISIPEVLSARFSVRRLITGVSRTVRLEDGSEKMLGEVFVTAHEAQQFIGFDAANLYKNVAGMNPIQLLHAISYAVKEQATSGPVKVEKLYQAIRDLKVQTAAKNFEVPNVCFDDIGGYNEVKNTLAKALNLITGAYQLPNEELRRELIPRGLIFYGPPGTGKTLFAKAIANTLNATIQVVSGPEVMDMYVGESERKIREFFAEARRNAPSVLVFDEFDAIATKRSGREDGGNRAGNAVVAQMLTEMDGFRPDVPMLVIGTTNRLELIDEALLRPSRFQAIPIDLPDEVARRAIIQVHAKHFQVDKYLSPALLDIIAKATSLFNGDEIRLIFRQAYVGLHCENPPREINAQRFGELVGEIRHNKEKRNTDASRHETTPTYHTQTTPSSPMSQL
jgi:transitional endoplasmic reticulum ATPase